MHGHREESEAAHHRFPVVECPLFRPHSVREKTYAKGLFPLLFPVSRIGRRGEHCVECFPRLVFAVSSMALLKRSISGILIAKVDEIVVREVAARKVRPRENYRARYRVS